MGTGRGNKLPGKGKDTEEDGAMAQVSTGVSMTRPLLGRSGFSAGKTVRRPDQVVMGRPLPGNRVGPSLPGEGPRASELFGTHDQRAVVLSFHILKLYLLPLLQPQIIPSLDQGFTQLKGPQFLLIR